MLENYSPGIQKSLKRINASVGDRIKVTKKGETYEGLVMPRIKLGDKNSLVLKLNSGYNIGVRHETGVKMSKVKIPKKPKSKPLELKFDKNRPKITIIVTGGTIASKVEYETGGVIAIEKPEELLMNIPELQELANITFVSPFKKMSEDMDYKDWQKLAKTVADELNKGNNVIITHGTDTLHYTSAALSFMLKGQRPVVLTAAQRSPDRGSSDAATNLVCSVYAALSDLGEIGICMHGSMNDDFCSFNKGTRVRKMHTTRRDTFKTFEDEPLAKIWTNGKIEKFSVKKRTDEKVEVDDKFEEKVALIKVYAGSDPDILNYYVKKGYKGFVLEGLGLGHVPTDLSKKSWLDNIKKITKKGIPVFVAAQTLYGRINTDVYTNLRKLYHEAGAISAEDMLPEVAFVKLGWVLGHTKDIKKVKEMMLTNIAGEISERSKIKRD